MKFTKYLFLTICATALCTSAFAQKAGLYTLLSGGTTTIPTVATNQFIIAGVTNQLGAPSADAITSSNLTQTVGEYNTAGLTWQFAYPAGSTNGAVTLFVYKSFDNGATYEASPSYTYTVTPAAPGAGVWLTNMSITLTDATHIGFSVENKAVGYITNCLLKVNLKAARVISKTAVN